MTYAQLPPIMQQGADLYRATGKLQKIKDLCKEKLTDYADVVSAYQHGRNDFASKVYSILDMG